MGRTKVRSARLSSESWNKIHAVRTKTPPATHGSRNARAYANGDSDTILPTWCMPRPSAKFPKTLVTTARRTNILSRNAILGALPLGIGT